MLRIVDPPIGFDRAVKIALSDLRTNTLLLKLIAQFCLDHIPARLTEGRCELSLLNLASSPPFARVLQVQIAHPMAETSLAARMGRGSTSSKRLNRSNRFRRSVPRTLGLTGQATALRSYLLPTALGS